MFLSNAKSVRHFSRFDVTPLGLTSCCFFLLFFIFVYLLQSHSTSWIVLTELPLTKSSCSINGNVFAMYK
jgi:hypothetical protein